MTLKSIASPARRTQFVAVFLAILVTSCASRTSAPASSPVPTATPTVNTETLNPSPSPVLVTQTPVPTSASTPKQAPPTPTVAPTVAETPTVIPTATSAVSPTATPAVTQRPADQTVNLPDTTAHYTLNITNLNVATGTIAVDEGIDISSQQGYIPQLYFTVTTAKWGYFTLDNASVDGTLVKPVSLNDGFTLALQMPSGNQWTVGFVFQLHLTQVPRDWYGSGMDGTIMRLGYWFPILSTNFPYPSTADPAYTRISSFDVSLPLPDGIPYVSTGVETGNERLDSSHTRHEIHADNVRDFALVIAPGDRIDTLKSDNGVTIRLLSDPADGDATRAAQLDAAKKTIETLSRLIGPYPYPIFSMADAGPSLPGGIEFPMLIQLNPLIKPINRLVYHETAHQWLYGLIGTRPQQDIWIDEGGAQFLEGYLDSGTPLPKVPAGGYPYALDSSDSELPQGAGIPGYNSIYLHGQLFYNDVLTTMGTSAFWKVMQQLYDDHLYGIVTPWDVLLTWQTNSPVDLRPLFSKTFHYGWIDKLPAPGG